jgi:pimeloyl-ACP methyl ester carboxylesterase
MVTYVLVHGTFARSADWPNLKRALAAGSNGERVNFEEVPWTGRNNAKARQSAAASIAEYVEQAYADGGQIFLIGHSHGGSAIAYFMKQRHETAKRICGCAFLSTPFVALRPREASPLYIALAAMIFAFSLYGAWNEYMRSRIPVAYHPDGLMPTISEVMMRTQDVLFDPVYYLGATIALSPLAIAFYFTKRCGDREAVLQKCRLQQTAESPSGKMLSRWNRL